MLLSLPQRRNTAMSASVDRLQCLVGGFVTWESDTMKPSKLKEVST